MVYMCVCGCDRAYHNDDNECLDCKKCNEFRGAYQWPQWTGYWWYRLDQNIIYYYNKENMPHCLQAAGLIYEKFLFKTDKFNFSPITSNPFFPP